MISNVSKLSATKLINKGIIHEDDRELYEYGLFLLISNVLFISITILVGSIAGILVESLIFFIGFCTIRQYAGGYHANTELRCEVSTISIIGLSVFLMTLFTQRVHSIILGVVATVFSVIIFIFSPIDTDEKLLAEVELKAFCKKTKIILVCIYLLILISFFLKISSISNPCCMSLILEGVLLIGGKIKKQNKNRYRK